MSFLLTCICNQYLSIFILFGCYSSTYGNPVALHVMRYGPGLGIRLVNYDRFSRTREVNTDNPIERMWKPLTSMPSI